MRISQDKISVSTEEKSLISGIFLHIISNSLYQDHKVAQKWMIYVQ